MYFIFSRTEQKSPNESFSSREIFSFKLSISTYLLLIYLSKLITSSSSNDYYPIYSSSSFSSSSSLFILLFPFVNLFPLIYLSLTFISLLKDGNSLKTSSFSFVTISIRYSSIFRSAFRLADKNINRINNNKRYENYFICKIL